MTRHGYPDQPKIKTWKMRLLLVLAVIGLIILVTWKWVWPVWVVLLGFFGIMSLFFLIPYTVHSIFVWIREGGKWLSPRAWWSEYGF